MQPQPTDTVSVATALIATVSPSAPAVQVNVVPLAVFDADSVSVLSDAIDDLDDLPELCEADDNENDVAECAAVVAWAVAAVEDIDDSVEEGTDIAAYATGDEKGDAEDNISLHFQQLDLEDTDTRME